MLTVQNPHPSHFNTKSLRGNCPEYIGGSVRRNIKTWSAWS